MREMFGDGVDIVLLGDMGLDGMKSAMAKHGLKMIMQEGVTVMASQLMEMDVDKAEEMMMVKQKNVYCPYCNVGFRSSKECLLSLLQCWVPELKRMSTVLTAMLGS